MIDETPVWIVIVLVTIGFFALAAILLVPVYRFLLREEEVSKKWVESKAARDPEEGVSSNGAADDSH